MNTIKLFAIISLIAIAGLHAQGNNWVGIWNTNIGQVIISQDGNDYKGTLPGGTFTAKYNAGDLLGLYNRTKSRYDRSGLGEMGEFRFVMFEDQSKFEGQYRVEGKDIWQEIQGTRQIGVVIEPIPTNIAEYYFEWNGTWKTDKLGTLKVLVTDKDHVDAKYSYNNKKNYGDIKGSLGKVNAYNDQKWFTGTVTNEKKITGRIEFYIYEKDKFKGYIMWNDGRKNALGMPTPGTTTAVTATRLSTTKPDMRSYP